MSEPQWERPHLDVRIDGEIGALEQVVVHRPGDEVVRMTQHELEQLLFDDILSPGAAVLEHDLMVEILEGAGARVVDVQDLLVRALDRAPAASRLELLTAVCELAGTPELVDVLHAFEAERLARALVCGLRWRELDDSCMTLGRLHNQLFDDRDIALPPQPNLMFMRDPCAAVGDRVVVGRMATAARAREPLLVAFALVHSGAFDEVQLCFDEPALRHPSYRRFEGGDALVLSPQVLLVGCSERTSAQTIERVSEALFTDIQTLERVYTLMMPAQRSVMHLDTILTQIDRRLFLGHEPLIAGQRALPVVRLEAGQPPRWLEGATMLDLLRSELGDDVQLVPCGGADALHQKREQWTDGANALCVAPGHIILYARNVHTIDALAAHGFEAVDVHMVQSAEERAERVARGMQLERAVFSFPGSELSRARGGGRCLTMPLRRRATPL